MTQAEPQLHQTDGNDPSKVQKIHNDNFPLSKVKNPPVSIFDKTRFESADFMISSATSKKIISFQYLGGLIDHDLFGGFFCLFRQHGEGIRIMDGQVGQHLSVNLDPCRFQAVDEATVGKPVETGGSIDT